MERQQEHHSASQLIACMQVWMCDLPLHRPLVMHVQPLLIVSKEGDMQVY